MKGMAKIAEAKAPEILDMRGNPAVGVEVHLSGGAKGRTPVPNWLGPEKNSCPNRDWKPKGRMRR